MDVSILFVFSARCLPSLSVCLFVFIYLSVCLYEITHNKFIFNFLLFQDLYRRFHIYFSLLLKAGGSRLIEQHFEGSPWVGMLLAFGFQLYIDWELDV